MSSEKPPYGGANAAGRQFQLPRICERAQPGGLQIIAAISTVFGAIIARSVAILSLALIVACAPAQLDIDGAASRNMRHELQDTADNSATIQTEKSATTLELTEDEKQLQRLGQMTLRPSWTKDWIRYTDVEPARNRRLPEASGRMPADLYAKFLLSEEFNSTIARYGRILSDVKADANLVPPFCKVARTVQRWNKKHLDTLYQRAGVTMPMYRQAIDRVWQNEAIVQWVSQALRYRVNAYRLALDNLKYEGREGKLRWSVNSALANLEQRVRLTELECDHENRFETSQNPPRRSRIYTAD